MLLAARRRIAGWLFALRGPQSEPVILVHRRVFILPTSHGIVFSLVLLLMLAGSINYSLSLGFILTFLLAGLGIVGILHTFRNLANLRVARGRTEPVFAGGAARFPVRIENPTDVPRAALEIGFRSSPQHDFDLAAHGETVVTLTAPALRRGWMHADRITLQTRFPLGLFHAWSYAELAMRCLVYPRPETPGVPLPAASAYPGEGTLSGHGTEDFATLRAYHPGDSPKHIAWKADARGQGLLTKVFSGRADAQLRFDWSALPPELDTEARLSRLTRWVLEADRLGCAFGLELPGRSIEPDSGDGHRERCLEALALHAL